MKSLSPNLVSPDYSRQDGLKNPGWRANDGAAGGGVLGMKSPTVGGSKQKILSPRMYTRNLEQYFTATLQYNMHHEVAMGVIERQDAYARAGTLISPKRHRLVKGGKSGNQSQERQASPTFASENLDAKTIQLQKGTPRGLEIALARLDQALYNLDTTIMLLELM